MSISAARLIVHAIEFNGNQWEVVKGVYPTGQVKLELVSLNEPAHSICCTAHFDMLNFGATQLTVIKDYGDSAGSIVALENAGVIEIKAYKASISDHDMVLVKVLI